MENFDNEAKGKTLAIRIDAELHGILKARSERTGRPQTTEALRLIQKGLAVEQTLGSRGDSGFDLMSAFSLGGARAAIRYLIDNGASGMELRQYILSAEASLNPEALARAFKEPK